MGRDVAAETGCERGGFPEVTLKVGLERQRKENTLCLHRVLWIERA